MTRTRFVAFALTAALLPTAAALAQTGSGTPTPPPTRPGGGAGGGTGGAAGDGQRTPRGPGGERGPGGRGVADERMWMSALDQISSTFSADQKTKIDAITSAYRASLDEWQKKNGDELRSLQKRIAEGRRSGEKVDPGVTERIKQIQESKPKFDRPKAEITGLLNKEQQDAHKKALDALEAKRGERGGRPGRGEDGKGDRPGRGGKGAPPPPPPGDKAPPPPPA